MIVIFPELLAVLVASFLVVAGADPPHRAAGEEGAAGLDEMGRLFWD